MRKIIKLKGTLQFIHPCNFIGPILALVLYMLKACLAASRTRLTQHLLVSLLFMKDISNIKGETFSRYRFLVVNTADFLNLNFLKFVWPKLYICPQKRKHLNNPLSLHLMPNFLCYSYCSLICMLLLSRFPFLFFNYATSLD